MFKELIDIVFVMFDYKFILGGNVLVMVRRMVNEGVEVLLGVRFIKEFRESLFEVVKGWLFLLFDIWNDNNCCVEIILFEF